jgi:hypothetical protein
MRVHESWVSLDRGGSRDWPPRAWVFRRMMAGWSECGPDRSYNTKKFADRQARRVVFVGEVRRGEMCVREKFVPTTVALGSGGTSVFAVPASPVIGAVMPALVMAHGEIDMTPPPALPASCQLLLLRFRSPEAGAPNMSKASLRAADEKKNKCLTIA